jgi:hypothetical protein
MTNEDPRIAPLRRKIAATEDPAKVSELEGVLRGLGFDPDAAEKVSPAPKGRSTPKRETTEDTRAKPAPSRPARPAAKPATSKPAAAKKTGDK